MKTFASKLADLRCPHCSTLQSLFALGLTYRGALVMQRVQEFVACETCGTHLRMSDKITRHLAVATRIAVPVIWGVISLLMLVLLARAATGVGGFILAIVIWWIIVALLGLVLQGLGARYAHKAEVAI